MHRGGDFRLRARRIHARDDCAVDAGGRLLARHWQARATDQPTWLDSTPFGLLIGVGLIPAVAITARRAPLMSMELAHAFITVLLFSVFIPAAWAAVSIPRRVPALAHLAVSALWALAPIAIADQTVVKIIGVGVALGCAMVVWRARDRLAPTLLALWSLLPLSLVAATVLPAARSYRWHIAGLHMIILGPVVCSFLWRHFTRLSAGARGAYFAALALMGVSIVFPDIMYASAPALATALASTAFAGVAIAITTKLSIQA